MNKDKILRQLQAVINEMTLGMKESDIEKHIDQDTFEMKFDHFLWNEKAKIQTKINMKKTVID